jgi:hypothetical protein
MKLCYRLLFKSFTSFQSFKMRGLSLSLGFTLLSAFAANASVLDDSEYAVILSRQAPGTPQFECHSDCGMLHHFLHPNSKDIFRLAPLRWSERTLTPSSFCLFYPQEYSSGRGNPPKRAKCLSHTTATNTFLFRQRPRRRTHPQPLRQLNLGRLLRGLP